MSSDLSLPGAPIAGFSTDIATNRVCKYSLEIRNEENMIRSISWFADRDISIFLGKFKIWDLTQDQR